VQLKTKLKTRTLWFDGTTEVTPEELPKLLLEGVPVERLAVTEVTPEVERFNQVSDTKLATKRDIPAGLFPPNWSFPDRYKYLDIDEYLVGLADKVERDELYERRLARLAEEIDVFTKLGLHDVLRALIYVVDELTRQQVVWGVGRGSSCSSYLLYLIGLHEVDAVRFDVPLSDFIRE
jgi:DNA polymerase III alpha subunit